MAFACLALKHFCAFQLSLSFSSVVTFNLCNQMHSLLEVMLFFDSSDSTCNKLTANNVATIVHVSEGNFAKQTQIPKYTMGSI